MLRACISGVIGFILIFVESYIVMQFKGLENIYFGGIAPFMNIWALNFFFVFTMMTHLYIWYEQKYGNDDVLDN